MEPSNIMDPVAETKIRQGGGNKLCHCEEKYIENKNASTEK
jgi:hypothetical protein